MAHIGDLNDYFYGNQKFKALFLQTMHDTFNDSLERYFVPEVNSGTSDLMSIIEDVRSVGFNLL